MNFAEILKKAANGDELLVAVAQADEEEVIDAVLGALERKMARFLLFGDKEKMISLIKEKSASIDYGSNIIFHHAPTHEQSGRLAVQAVSSHEADILMKGNIPTAQLLKEVLNKEYGLRGKGILSQVALFEIPTYERLLFITDSAMNILPGLQEKVQIIENAVQLAHAIGIDTPKVAPLAAVEVINPAMQATVDAAALTQMNRRGQIKGCIIDGPLGFDNAISMEACQHKGITSDVAGRADILLVPNLEVGNTLYKSLTYFAKAKVGSLLVGARAPIVLTSRSDTAESKLYSLALALCAAKK